MPRLFDDECAMKDQKDDGRLWEPEVEARGAARHASATRSILLTSTISDNLCLISPAFGRAQNQRTWSHL